MGSWLKQGFKEIATVASLEQWPLVKPDSRMCARGGLDQTSTLAFFAACICFALLHSHFGPCNVLVEYYRSRTGEHYRSLRSEQFRKVLNHATTKGYGFLQSE